MNASKRKRIVLTLEEKLEVINLRGSGIKNDRIAEKFNIGISTISEICKKRNVIENAVEKGKLVGNVKRKTLKEGRKPIVEDQLYFWFMEQRVPPRKSEIFEKAREVDQQHSKNAEVCWIPSTSWYKGFCARYGINEPRDQIMMEEEVSQIDSIDHDRTALESAEFLLSYMDSREFALKDIITLRMIRDKIANEFSE